MGEAAQQCGVAERTIYRWLNEETAFKNALREAEKAALEMFTRQLVGMAEKASQAIRDGLEDSNINIRLRAADAFLNRLIQLRQLVDFEERLAALERANNGDPEK